MGKRSWLHASEDLVHTIEKNTLEDGQVTEGVVNLLGPKGGETFVDVFNGGLGELRIDDGESFAADFLVFRAGKMPRELDGSLLHGRLGRRLSILHLDILDRHREGFKAEAKGLG